MLAECDVLSADFLLTRFGVGGLQGAKLLILWRPRPELNRGKRFCRPLRNHSATWPSKASPATPPAHARRSITERSASDNRAAEPAPRALAF